MSCGLGAVILVLILLKHQPAPAPVETELLKSDLDRLTSTEEALEAELTALAWERQQVERKIRDQGAAMARMGQQMGDVSMARQSEEAKLESLKKEIEAAPPARTSDVMENNKGQEENYLLGLKVEGRRIAFLIDTSASMTDEKLIDIILRKSGSDGDKIKGPKWLRTKRIAQWLLARLPKNADAIVIGFNNRARKLGPAAWFSSTDEVALKSALAALDEVIPADATNLQQGLKVAKAMTPKPTNYYLVTDGLPTSGDSRYASLNPFSSCSSLLGKSNTISGDCRVKLFRQTVSESGPLKGDPINVILLPLEGDPQAAPEFWRWTYLTGGLLISPAETWP